jgi:hypothetical protein
MSSRQLEERQEEDMNRKLASALGISYSELIQLDWEVDTNESNDGLIYEYLVIFSENSSKTILKKIEDIDDSNTVRLPPWAFDEPEVDEEP